MEEGDVGEIVVGLVGLGEEGFVEIEEVVGGECEGDCEGVVGGVVCGGVELYEFVFFGFEVEVVF